MDIETNNTISDKEISSIIIGKLLNIGGVLQRHGDKLLLPFDLNQQQFSIFFEIAKAGKVRQKDIVNRLLLEKAHISKVIKKLQRMDLITITLSDKDKRSSWLSTTKKGTEVLNKCMDIFEEWNKKWLNTIDKKQLSMMLENLTMLQSLFKSQTQRNE